MHKNRAILIIPPTLWRFFGHWKKGRKNIVFVFNFSSCWTFSWHFRVFDLQERNFFPRWNLISTFTSKHGNKNHPEAKKISQSYIIYERGKIFSQFLKRFFWLFARKKFWAKVKAGKTSLTETGDRKFFLPLKHIFLWRRHF